MTFDCRSRSFWLRDPRSIICSADVLPLAGMPIAEQYNAVTRLVLMLAAAAFLLRLKMAPAFLVSLIALIVVGYYVETRPKDVREDFADSRQIRADGTGTSSAGPEFAGARITYASPLAPPCPSPVPVPLSAASHPSSPRPARGQSPPNCYMSRSQRLAGPANPKTLVAPVIVPPAMDLDYWRKNNMVYHSAVNSQAGAARSASGYQVSTCCPPGAPRVGGIEPYHDMPVFSGNPSIPTFPSEVTLATDYHGTEDAKLPAEPKSIALSDGQVVRPNESGWMNTACGYNPRQIQASALPSNLAAGPCEQAPHMKKYNENIFTQTVTPDLLSRSEIIEPLSSNIGISFDQQPLPETRASTSGGTETVTFRDPRIARESVKERYSSPGPNAANVYDPRLSGYGTSYRSYIDPVTGQIRFAYDDVDAVRMPNYIVRSKIDTLPAGDSYGPLPAGWGDGNPNTHQIRRAADAAFINRTSQFRDELQLRMMAKSRAREWQRRVAPIRTSGSRFATAAMTC